MNPSFGGGSQASQKNSGHHGAKDAVEFQLHWIAYVSASMSEEDNW